MRRLAAALALLGLVAIAALAQDATGGRSDNGFLINLLENRLSTPSRQIRLSGVSGALSSRARIAQITISDTEGTWLAIDNAEVDWSRLALLRGRVDVNRMSAERITWMRRAVQPPPARNLPRAEATPFALPELPVSIRLRELALDEIRFEEPVFGQAAQLSATGSLDLARGALDSAIRVTRLDSPGGQLALGAAFSNQTRQLDLDLDLQEPKGGVVATLLKIEGAPAIDLRLQGSGPLDQVDVTFSLDADSDRIAQGLVALQSSDEGLGFSADFGGSLSPLVPAEFRDFFAGPSTVRVQGVKPSAGGLRIDDLDVAGAVLQLNGDLETGPDNFLRNLTLMGTLGDPRGPAVVLPVPGGRTRLHSAVLHVNYGDATRWDGLLVLDRLQTADIEMEDVTFRLGGLAQNLEDPATRRVTVNVEGLATGLWAPKPEVARALGTRIDLFAEAELNPGGPIDLNQLQISGNGLSIFAAGSFENLTFTGRNAIRVADLAIFSGLANRTLGGAVNLRANGSVSPLSGGFDLTFDGSTTDLALGEPRLDALAAGATTLSGRAVRDEAGFRTENLRLANPQLTFASNGHVSTTSTDFGFDAALTDLALLDSRARGALTATGQATGEGFPIDLTLSAGVPEGELMGRRLTGAEVGFTGQATAGGAVTGRLTGDGALDGLLMRLAGDLAVAGDRRALSGLEVVVGPNRLTGDIALTGAAPIEGRLTLDAPDIAPLAAFGLVDATGSIDADITLGAAEVGQGVDLTATARDLAIGANRIGALNARASVVDALGLPLIDGTLEASDLALAGFEVASLNARAEHTDGTSMRFSAESRLAIGTLADLSGELVRLDGGFAATLDTLRIRQQGVAATLTAPATVTFKDGTVELTPLGLDFGTGNLTAEGRIDDAFDVDLAMQTLPLDIANAIRPALGLGGTVNGTARVTGPRASPDVRFNVSAAGVVSATTRSAGLPPIALDATGTTANGHLTLRSSVAATGLAATANGTVPLGAGDLALDINLQSFPLTLVDRLAGNRGLRGTVSGQARVTGPIAAPAAEFDLRGENLSANVLDEFGIPPPSLTAAGSYRAGTLTLRSMRATGGGGDLAGSGRIPLSGPGLDVSVSGTVPLAVLNPVLEARASQAAGVLRVNATARGSLAAPQFAGNVSLEGGTFVDPQFNLRLEGISLDAGLEGNAAVLRSFRAEAASGGTITAQGRIGFAPGFPADLTGQLRDVRYTDGTFVATRLTGDLSMQGPLVGGGGTLSGRIDIGRTEISVAEGLGANAQGALDQVAHVHTPPAVQATLDRAKIGEPRPARESNRPGIGLNIRISAPNQIFVRGRGLDVEIGGQMTVQGQTNDIQPVGQFDLRRGRILILGQRIDFDEGSLQLVGNLDPLIHFVAETSSQDVTAIVTVDGRVSALEITFSSEPPLPQDEVLSRVLFNRATADLSAFQLAQLAAAAAELAGGGGPGILSQLRGATGLDDLDIITQDDGSTAVRAGKYIEDNIYLDLQSDTRGVSRAQVNLEVNRSVTARASVGSDGNTTFGLFYERDY